MNNLLATDCPSGRSSGVRVCRSGQRGDASAVYRQPVMWLIIGVTFAGVLIPVWLLRWMYREDQMGSVSGQWLAEYRQDHES